MTIFPEHARVHHIIAKENFYSKVDYPTRILFQNEIARIVWEYKLAPETINIAAKTWLEVEIFRLELKSYELSPKILKIIDSNIPYPILFFIVKDSAKKAAIGYKEQNQKNSNTAKVDTYFETSWNDDRIGDIKIDGLDTDTIYGNFIRQIAGDRLFAQDDAVLTNEDNNSECNAEPRSMKSDLERMKEREQIQKQIAALDRRIKAEPSVGKKQRLAEEKDKLLQLL